MARRKKSPDAVTIVDVAHEANVSYSTVSRVVNNKSYVKPETRERVLQAMNTLGYQANVQARSLAGGKTNVIGVMVRGIVGQYTAEIVRGIDDIIAGAGYDLMLYTTHQRTSRESAYVNGMVRGLAEGLLLILPEELDRYGENLRRYQYPYVLIDHRSVTGEDHSIIVANYEGAYAAIQHLINLGHRRIGFLKGTMDIYSAVDRFAAYTQALSNNNIPYDPDLVRQGDFLHPTGFAMGGELLDLAQRPTAIFASSDMMALGVMDAARMRGLSIPADLSLIGFDDIPMAAATYPRLTTVRQPLEEMGRVAAQILLRAMKNPSLPSETVILGTELIIRDSTAPLKTIRKLQEPEPEPLRR